MIMSVENYQDFALKIKPFLIEAIKEIAETEKIDAEQWKILLELPPLSSPTQQPKEHHTIDTTSDISTGLLLIRGYPLYPLYDKICNIIAYWMGTGQCPVFDLPVMFLLNEQAILDVRKDRMESLTSKLKGAYSLWDCWSDGEKKFFFVEILKTLGIRGVLDLLGVRQTVGSVNVFPPSKEKLLSSFVKLHCPPAKLTVGARALAKHHHRDDTTSWWGKCTGSEDEKNSHALSLILKIFDNATWINIHHLPHDVKVVEMRTVEGYGARWLLDGTEFRGFLEPQMEDGHAVGWRH